MVKVQKVTNGLVPVLVRLSRPVLKEKDAFWVKNMILAHSIVKTPKRLTLGNLPKAKARYSAELTP
jgi:hypothetical protein